MELRHGPSVLPSIFKQQSKMFINICKSKGKPFQKGKFSTIPDMNMESFPKEDWHYTPYADANEELPPIAPAHR
eukprot:11368756-Ditylum_brightwellii.AAC.1